MFNVAIYGQEKNWKTISDEGYSIMYPDNWELDQSGQMGTSFSILSELDSEKDQFRENINLIIQDLSAYEIDLDEYVEISENQINTMISNSKIMLNKRVERDGYEYQHLIYTAKQGLLELKLEQYYWVINKSAYVLTFTCEEHNFKNYKKTGERILNSFKLK